MYDIILFDVDGVFLSEERCFDASALSVWELLHAPHFLNLDGSGYTHQPSEEQIRAIRKEVFQDNRILDWMKTKGINSNWDMVYLNFSAQLLLILKKLYTQFPEKVRYFLSQPITEQSLAGLKEWGGPLLTSYQPSYDQLPILFQDQEKIEKHELLVYFNDLASRWFDTSVHLFSRNSTCWMLGYSVYQEWYLGDQLYQETEKKNPRIEGKRGFLYQEIPIVAPDRIRMILERIRAKGIVLGIGTGRRWLETKVPLTELELLSVFDADRIITASDVIQAEEAYPEYSPLGKPEPFTYVKGLLSQSATVEECIQHPLPVAHGKKVLIVGDSVADYLAARKMGCDFAATLTGLTGQDARSKFEELKADYILNDVSEVEQII
ncbi:HAD family hydrolase [Hazenella coriacea]|uniref:HAD-hyrolase-like protein n=1 Tax=Hazenella coriacea TaxID=1179467 RepID=A0A4R3L5D3_9BACL|nr:HAD hydrolase-like protein [Hazenella coriacea]TCS92346.1 HAD-hyrolase-like protein [Hazenella coriacea]